MPTQIGLQVYTLRNQLRNPADIAQTMARVKQIGYEAVELAGLGPIEPEELAKILTGEGLTCCSTHISTNDLNNGMQRLIDNQKLWNCNTAIIASFGPRNASSQTWVDFAENCNKWGATLGESGITLGYHNHSHELVHYDGKPGLQIMIEHFSPQVTFEIDVHWIARGGGDPAQWVGKVANHVFALHMKDMSVMPDRSPRFAEVGEGNLNWPAILDAAKKAGVKYYIVEQDDTYGKDPFECIETSLKNMKAMGLS